VSQWVDPINSASMMISLFVIVFLGSYLFRETGARGGNWLAIWRRLPPSMGLAVAFLTFVTGAFLRSRFFDDYRGVICRRGSDDRRRPLHHPSGDKDIIRQLALGVYPGGHNRIYVPGNFRVELMELSHEPNSILVSSGLPGGTNRRSIDSMSLKGGHHAAARLPFPKSSTR
jgi:hypothetical protein